MVKIALSQEDFVFVTELSTKERWAIGTTDVTHLGPIVEPGFFIGVLDGVRIGHISAVKYNDEDIDGGFYYVGFYLVDKDYRGRGYGLKIWNVMWESLDKSYNISLDAVNDLVPLYEKMGLQKEWTNKEYFLSSSKVVQALNGAQEMMKLKNILIKPLSEVSFDKIFKYDTSVFGFPRQKFLKRWITIPDSLGWAAINVSGDIVGYVVIRPSVIGKDELLVAPLFADDTNIARMLLYASTEAAMIQKSVKNLRIFVPVSANPEGADMIENEIGYDSAWSSARMYSKGIPPQICLRKVVAITSPGLE